MRAHSSAPLFVHVLNPIAKDQSLTDEEFAQVMILAHELGGVEFKGPGPLSNGRLTAQVVRAMLGMANRRDGGIVIVGVSEQEDSLDPVGLSGDDLGTWGYDDLADQVARYADPGIAFELEVKEYNHNQFVVVQVEEFGDIPVLCKKAYDNVLRDGACYVRTRRKPETSEIPTQADMRDLLDLAVEKRLRQELERARRVGLFSPATLASPPNDQERFESQMGDFI